ncbi:MAG: alpha/beta hydrolase [Alphaproteobacteria bacterium]
MQQKSYQGLSPLGFHNIAYTEWGNASSPQTLLCVHGLTRNGRDFDWLAEDLQSEMRVICPDMVGRGKSDRLKDPALYSYAQYMSDITALIARTGAESIDWVGTSMGGILGMYMAAQAKTPIRRLVINDVGPFIPLTSLKRIADYVGMPLEFADVDQLERHIRNIYAPFGITEDADWKRLAETSTYLLENGKRTLSHDIGIAKNFQSLKEDVNFWQVYDQIKCPTLILRGSQSDVLSAETAKEMTQRGPRAKLIEFKNVGHAPALINSEQIEIVRSFIAQ